MASKALSISHTLETVTYKIPSKLDGTKWYFEVFFYLEVPGKDSKSERQVTVTAKSPRFIVQAKASTQRRTSQNKGYTKSGTQKGGKITSAKRK
jgi:hypothetical protein